MTIKAHYGTRIKVHFLDNLSISIVNKVFKTLERSLCSSSKSRRWVNEFWFVRCIFSKNVFDNSQIKPSTTARNLGVTFDSHLNLESHINSVCRSAYFHLRNIRSVRKMLTYDACSQLIHALVTVRIDYCNSLLYGLPDQSLNRLQRIVNTAARILCRIPKFGHISETLMDLHWLPVQQRVLFKVLIFNLSGIP